MHTIPSAFVHLSYSFLFDVVHRHHHCPRRHHQHLSGLDSHWRLVGPAQELEDQHGHWSWSDLLLFRACLSIECVKGAPPDPASRAHSVPALVQIRKGRRSEPKVDDLAMI